MVDIDGFMVNLDEFTECAMCGNQVQGHDVVMDGFFGALCPNCGASDEAED